MHWSMARTGTFALLFVVMFAVPPGPAALAQQLQGCAVAEVRDPPRSVFRCEGGLVIEAEAASALRLVVADPDGAPRRVEVRGRGVLVDLPPGSGRFQIMTPHAIASVRGTVYAVDVSANQTDVFVQEGSVHVSRPDGSDSVVLRAGEGVDVVPGQPLEVKQWGEARVERLLARFGR